MADGGLDWENEQKTLNEFVRINLSLCRVSQVFVLLELIGGVVAPPYHSLPVFIRISPNQVDFAIKSRVTECQSIFEDF